MSIHLDWNPAATPLDSSLARLEAQRCDNKYCTAPQPCYRIPFGSISRRDLFELIDEDDCEANPDCSGGADSARWPTPWPEDNLDPLESLAALVAHLDELAGAPGR